MDSTNSNRRTTLGFAAVIAAGIALMPMLVETAPLSADAAPTRPPASQGIEIAALR